MAINLNYTNKTIELTSAYTLIELYSSLMDTFDELDQMDDPVPIKYNTPTEFELINGWDFMTDASVQYLSGGSIIVNKTGGNDVWANIYTLGTIAAGANIYVVQDGASLTSFWASGHIDILVKVVSGGAAIDGRDLTIMAREWGDKFDHFTITIPATGGRNAIPIATEADLNNTTDVAVIGALPGLNITFGTIARDLNNGNGARNYDVEIDCGGLGLDQVYEYLKYRTYDGAAGTLSGVNAYAYTAANGAYAEVKAAPFGTFAGGTFFGARGVWITNYDAGDANSFQLIDAAGVTQSPPMTVPISVGSIASGDRVGVFRLVGVGGAINKAEYTVSGAHASSATTLAVSASIASDVPASGVVRVGDARHAYSSFAGAVFTLVGSIGVEYVGGEDVYVPLIDEQATSTSVSTSITYDANIPVLVRVRAYGILPFEVETTVTSSGLAVSAIRTEDTVVS